MRLYLLAGAGAVLLICAGLFYWHYSHLKSEAAKVPVLTARVEAMAKADKDRASVDQQFSVWLNQTLIPTMKGLPRAASASSANCLPRPDERGVRNQAIGKLLPGTSGPSQ